MLGDVPTNGEVPLEKPRPPSFSDVGSRALECALNSGNKFASPLKLPWKSGFLKDVLGGGSASSLPWLSPVLVPRDLPSSGLSRLKVAPSINEKRSKAKAQMLTAVAFGKGEGSQTALAKWLDLVMMYPEESRLGIILLAETMRGPSDEGVPQLMEHWMARKSTSIHWCSEQARWRCMSNTAKLSILKEQ